MVPSDDEKEEEKEEQETNLPPSILCHTCQSVLNDDEDQIVCSHCQHSFHRHCLEIGQDMFNIIKTYSWQCIDCKSCLKCNRSDDEVRQRSIEKTISSFVHFRSIFRQRLCFVTVVIAVIIVRVLVFDIFLMGRGNAQHAIEHRRSKQNVVDLL